MYIGRNDAILAKRENTPHEVRKAYLYRIPIYLIKGERFVWSWIRSQAAGLEIC